MRKTLILSLIMVIGVAELVSAQDLLVPSQYPTIQAAVDAAAAEGDTVIVADGTYTGDGNRDIDFLGKAITVKSENGPESTIIDCQGTESSQHRGFYFHTGEDTNSVLEGFTITGGYASHLLPEPFGAAILCKNAGPSIINCIITNNYSEMMAGGISCYDGEQPTITNCIITGNENVGVYGCDGPITDCVISNNIADRDSGGGLNHCNGPITNCVISNNNAERGGGLNGCNGPITNCLISNNSAYFGGGLAYCDGPITDCLITQNSAWEGAAILGCYGTISGCTISKNTGTSFGSVISRGQAEFRNCRITENSSEGSILEGCHGPFNNCQITANSSEYSTFSNCYVSFNNCLITENSSSMSRVFDHSGPFNNCLITANSSRYAFSSSGFNNCLITANSSRDAFSRESIFNNCTIAGNRPLGQADYMFVSRWEPQWINSCIIWGNDGFDEIGDIRPWYSCIQGWTDQDDGNISSDPRFVEPGYWDPNGTPADTSDDFWVEGDYHLAKDSPCINTGDPYYNPEPNETDLGGLPRVIEDIVDMGAYEFADPLDLLAELAESIDAMGLHKGTANSLLAKLDTAIEKLEDDNENNDDAAVNVLQAFINAVEAQRGKKIPESDADNLITAAQDILDLLTG